MKPKTTLNKILANTITPAMLEDLLTKRDITYTRAIYQFGIIPVLATLANFEMSEYYEECKMIKEAIDDLNNSLEENLPTQYNNAAFDYIKNVYQEQNLDIGKYRERLPEYCAECYNFCVKNRNLLDIGSPVTLSLNADKLEFWEGFFQE